MLLPLAPPPMRALEKVASFLRLSNTLIGFSPPALAPDRVLGLKMEHRPLHSRPQGAVLIYLWPGRELPTWTLYPSGPQLHPVSDTTESVAASVSLSTGQGPSDPWRNGQ